MTDSQKGYVWLHCFEVKRNVELGVSKPAFLTELVVADKLRELFKLSVTRADERAKVYTLTLVESWNIFLLAVFIFRSLTYHQLHIVC